MNLRRGHDRASVPAVGELVSWGRLQQFPGGPLPALNLIRLV